MATLYDYGQEDLVIPLPPPPGTGPRPRTGGHEVAPDVVPQTQEPTATATAEAPVFMPLPPPPGANMVPTATATATPTPVQTPVPESQPEPQPQATPFAASAQPFTGTGQIDRSSRSAFIRSMLPYALQAEKETGIPADIMLAINLNEQGWQHEAPGQNYFGIKGANPKTGATTGPVPTWEAVNGQRVNVNDSFRAYASPAESYADFGNFLKDNPRYAKALEVLKQTGDGAAFIKEVHKAGYATAPAWSDKIISIAKGIAGDAGRNGETVPLPPPPGVKPSVGREFLGEVGRQIGQGPVAAIQGALGNTIPAAESAWAGVGRPAVEKIASLPLSIPDQSAVSGVPDLYQEPESKWRTTVGQATSDVFGTGAAFGEKVAGAFTFGEKWRQAADEAAAGQPEAAEQLLRDVLSLKRAHPEDNAVEQIGRMIQKQYDEDPFPLTTGLVAMAADLTNLLPMEIGPIFKGVRTVDAALAGGARSVVRRGGEAARALADSPVGRGLGELATSERGAIEAGGDALGLGGKKQPWEMNLQEFTAEVRANSWEHPNTTELNPQASIETIREAHEGRVAAALSDGEPVPPKVLAEYPDLALVPDQVAGGGKGIETGQGALNVGDANQEINIALSSGLQKTNGFGTYVLLDGTVLPTNPGSRHIGFDGNIMDGNGNMFTPGAIREIRDANGKVIWQRGPEAGQAGATPPAAPAAPAALAAADGAAGPKFAVGDSVNPVGGDGTLLSAEPVKVTDVQTHTDGTHYYQVEGSKTYLPEDHIEPVAEPAAAAADGNASGGSGKPPEVPPADGGVQPDAIPEDAAQERGLGETLRTSERSSEPLRTSLEETPITYEGPRPTEVLSDEAKAAVDANPDKAESDLLAKNRNFDDHDVATSLHLIDRLTKEGATDEQLNRGVQLAEVVAADLTEHGRAIQAVTIWNRLSENGQLVRISRQLQKAKKTAGEEAVTGRLEEVAAGIAKGKGQRQLRESQGRAKQLTEAADDAAERAANEAEGGLPKETKQSRKDRAKVTAGIQRLANEGRSPDVPVDSQEIDLLKRMNKFAQETGWLLPHGLADDLVAVLDAIKQLPKAEQAAQRKQLVQDLADKYLPMLEERSKTYRETEAWIKRTREAVEYANADSRLVRAIGVQSEENKTLRELKRLSDRLGYRLPDELRQQVDDALTALRGGDVADQKRLAEAKRVIREDVGPVVSQLQDMEAKAKVSSGLIDKAGKAITWLGDMGRNPAVVKDKALDAEVLAKLASLQTNANRIGYLLPPKMQQELGSWLDNIKAMREGSPEKIDAIREYIKRLTTGDIAQEIEKTTAEFVTAKNNLSGLEKLTERLRLAARLPGKPQDITSVQVFLNEIRKTADEVGYQMPEALKAKYDAAQAAIAQMPEGPGKVQASEDFVRSVSDELLPDLYALRDKLAAGGKDAKWEEAIQRYLTDVEERINQPRIREDWQKASEDARRLARDSKGTLTPDMARLFTENIKAAKALPEGSPERWRAFKEIGRNVSDLIPPEQADVVLTTISEIANVPRATMAGLYDFSAVLRQGRVAAYSHPGSWGRALKPMLEAFADPEAAAQIEAQLRTRPTAAFWEKAKLYQAPRGIDATVATREDQFAGHFFGETETNDLKRTLGPGAWEDAYVTFLNKLRADIADSIYEKYARRGKPLTPEEAANYAQWINWMTGRGSLPKGLEQTSGIMAQFIFSPRNWAARVERPVAAGRAAYTVVLGPKAPGAYASRRIAGEIGKDYAAYMGVGMLLMGLASAAGLEVGWDRLKTNFGSIKIMGIDNNIWGDDANLARTLARLVQGQQVLQAGNLGPVDRGDVLARYASTQMSPQAGLVTDQVLTGRDFLGRDITGKARENSLIGNLEASLRDAGIIKGSPIRNALGETGGRVSNIAEHFTPGTIQSFLEAYGNDRGLGHSIGAAMGTAVGVSSQSFKSIAEVRNEITQAVWGTDYDAKDAQGVPLLTETQRRLVDDAPQVAEIIADSQRPLDQNAAKATVAEHSRNAFAKQQQADQTYGNPAQDGPKSGVAGQAWIKTHHEIGAGTGAVLAASGIAKVPRNSARNDAERLAADYYAIELKDIDGEPDYDGFFKQREDFMAGLSPQDRDTLNRLIASNSTKMEQAYRRDGEQMREYWKVADTVLQKHPQWAKELEDYRKADAATQAVMKRRGLVDKALKEVAAAKQLYRTRHRDVDLLLKKWGYVSKTMAEQLADAPLPLAR